MPLGVYASFGLPPSSIPLWCTMAGRKASKGPKIDPSTVSSPPLTEAGFERFLRIVTRPMPKMPRPEKEKPQTINTWAGLLSARHRFTGAS